MPISGTDPALTEARVGLMRVGGSRLGYVLPIPQATINGTDRTALTRIKGISIRDILNGTPNTATFRVSGFTPTEGHVVQLAFGDGPIEFKGRILSTTKIYEGKPANVAFDCQCISEEWLLNSRKVTKRYQSQSATAIIQDILATYTTGFSSAGVQAGLPTLDEITFTSEDVTQCLDRICVRIGEDWQLDYNKVLHVPAADGQSAHTITDSNDHSMVGIAVNTDLSQVRTRQSGEGMGSTASIDIAVGQTTMPLDDTGFANASGGTVVAGPQRITYTGKSVDADTGIGSKVGGKTGLAPGALTDDTVAETSGNLGVGTYKYKVTLVINGGETEAGTASGGATIAHVTNDASVTSLSGTTGGSLTTGNTYLYKITYVTTAGETVPSGFAEHTLSGGNNAISMTLSTSADDRVTKRRLYRVNYALGGELRLVTTINDNTTTSYTDTTADSTVGANAAPPTVDTSGSGQISLTNIPTGPSGTTARKIYRTAANGVDYKYHSTIPGNVTTTATDNTADSGLGEAAPTSSTVGPSVGDTSLPVQELSFYVNGGWVEMAGQLIRFTGRSAGSGAGTLTGVPSSGIGAITASVPYDTNVLNWPHLTGVTGILYPINKGDSVNLWVTRNDTAAQTFMAAAVGGDGILEGDPIQDRRMSEAEITARCDARLAEISTPLVTVRFATRDLTVKSGRDVTITLAAPTSISGTFRIQSVTLSGFSPNGQFRPLRQVECSSRRLSFEQILRLIKAA